MKFCELNPAVKAATCLICVILLSFQYLVTLNLAVFAVCLAVMLLSGAGRAWKLLLPAFVVAAGLFVTGLCSGRGAQPAQLEQIAAMPYAVRAAMSTDLYSALQLATRLLAYAGLGIAFAVTTDGEAFISSLIHQCRLPHKFAYGILAAVHLLPNLQRELAAVKLAFRVRGLRVSRHGLQIVFTMLVNAIRWSDHVAMAMESKGYCPDGERTYFSVSKVCWYDWALAAGQIGAIVLGMILLKY